MSNKTPRGGQDLGTWPGYSMQGEDKAQPPYLNDEQTD
jgi:hypothetical protein